MIVDDYNVKNIFELKKIDRQFFICKMMCCAPSHFNANQLKGLARKSNSLPTKKHIHSGIFSEQFFDINPTKQPITELVDAKFFSSTFQNPINQCTENYFLVGLISSEDGKNHREKTDIVIVIDRSGSMGSGLTETERSNFLQFGNETNYVQSQKTKMNLTIEATKEIFELLDDDQFIGIVAFDDRVEIVELLKSKSSIDQEELFDNLDQINARGGTNMEIGMEKAIQMLLSDPNNDRNKRILFITDACPNLGSDDKGLKQIAENAFISSNHTLGITYVGVGLSFNAEVSEELSKVRGTTIFNVNTSRELKKTLVEDFNYLITPVAFDVDLKLNCNGYSIDNVYGGDEDQKQSDRLLHFRTLTASSVNEKGVKGCAILIKLKEIPKSNEETESFVKIQISYTPSQSQEIIEKVFQVDLSNNHNSVIQKAISLAVFFDVLKEILPDTHEIKEKFEDSEKEKLNHLKEFLINQPDEVKSDLSNEIDIVERFLLL
jgi:Ca-activated chloride channel family protein